MAQFSARPGTRHGLPSDFKLGRAFAALLPGLLVLGYAVFCVHQALTENLVGPHRWDDFKYINRALTGKFDFHIRFRYAHVWGLRAFFELIEERRLAAAAYGAAMNGGLVLAAYALGARARGAVVGILGALLLSAFLPLAMFSSTPLCDPPCTLYASAALLCALRSRDAGASLVWAVLCGFLGFASLKSKETGIAVMPVLLWLLAARSAAPCPARKHPVLYAALGLLAGQVVLGVVDGLLSGDFLQSLRLSGYHKYVTAVRSLPRGPSATGRLLDRKEWMELLFEPGVREYAVAGSLGMVVGFRRSLVIRAMGLWTVFNLLFGSWVCFRYTGIDAHVRYLGPFAPALCVGSAYLLDRLLRLPGALSESDDAGSGPGGGLQPLSPWLSWLVILACLGLSGWGLYYGWRAYVDESPAFLVERGARFLFPLALPLSLVAAALVRPRAVRAVFLGLCLFALLLVGQKETHEYFARERREVNQWGKLAKAVAAMPEPKVALFHVVKPSIKPQLIRWRIAGLSEVAFESIRVREVDQAKDAHPDEILLVNYHRRKVRKLERRKVPSAEWRSFVRVPLDRRRARAYRYVGPK